MALIFQREQFTQALGEEGIPLAQMHNAEVGGVTAGVRVRVPQELYETLQASDSLRIYTLREDAELKGYNVFVVMNHPQFQARVAQHDSMFIHPSVRHGFNALKFLRWCDEQLKAEGTQFVFQHVTAQLDFSPILLRMGYKPHETIYSKQLT